MQRRALHQCTQLLLLLQGARRATSSTTTAAAARRCHDDRSGLLLGRRPRRCASLVRGDGVLRECRRFASMITRRRSRPKNSRSTPPAAVATAATRQPGQPEEKQQRPTAPAPARKAAVESSAAPQMRTAAAAKNAAAMLPKSGAPVNPVARQESGAPPTVAVSPSSASASASATGGGGNAAAAEIGSLLDIESPLNLRLATLMQQPGKAFRAFAVTFSTKRDINFAVVFEDIASGAKLQCRLDEVRSVYMPWVRQFHASWVVLFVPTLSTANAVLLENAVLYNVTGRADASEAGGEKALEEPDHVFMSYSKLRETLCKTKRDEHVKTELLSNAILNAHAEAWRSFIHSPGSCSPMEVVTAAFEFRAQLGQPLLNKQLLHAQLSAAATALQQPGKRSALSSSSAASRGSSHGTSRKKESWMLVFVSAPLASASGAGSVVPPMQDLLTGEFVEPLLLGEKSVIYIIGSGTAAESFAQFPLMRKGKQKMSILLQDIENQLGLRRPNRPTLTMTLIQALDLFSRYTWMGLMRTEDGSLRAPRPPRSFTPLHRRSVTCEIVPTFLESALGHVAHNLGAGGGGALGVAAGGAGGGGAMARGKLNRRLEEHIKAIFNSNERLALEQEWRTRLRGFGCFFMEVKSANVTAARRADNPFSARNGIVEFHGQLWRSLDAEAANPPPVETLSARLAANGDVKAFVEPERCVPAELPISSGVGGAAEPRAANAILVAWDVKRALLFLRSSGRLQQFLHNGGRIWCAQYAQYLLKGFNHDNLATMERTLLHYHIGQAKLHPLEKLRIIFERQLDIAVSTRQLISILHRMDGLLAATEMELRGLQISPQPDVTQFSLHLKRSHEKLERLVNDKIMEFTTGMDDEVRKRINFRSPQDISTIIYGGALCRHLGARYVPVQTARVPVTALFPHAVCRVTATPTPVAYTQPESLIALKASSNSSGSRWGKTSVTESKVRAALETIDKYTTRNTLENLLHCTAVVVLTCKVRPGNFLELVCLHCPSTDPGDELKYSVAIDDVVPVTDEPEMLTVTQLKEKIVNYKPLRALQPLKKYGKKSYDLRNLLILTNCTHDKLAALVDTGVVQAIAETVLGPHSADEFPS
ncbi:putative mitochondrial DNA polymerase I protein C [Trypanosoma conorhini]|uniref:Putative mitochondrial DNA polymerase I protein C n=1 Tax=Trypanosoma conorhini TaxID=83891 RepID=A0A422Q6S5_9TRYP|nr:putative mitochondrial DNA polymerase I protein C [Trypanosoma conorhini]RNF25685.1 putative mitochondrial DNA polymerase I protein C [Trypanosoma conorhini]